MLKTATLTMKTKHGAMHTITVREPGDPHTLLGLLSRHYGELFRVEALIGGGDVIRLGSSLPDWCRVSPHVGYRTYFSLADMLDDEPSDYHFIYKDGCWAAVNVG